MQVVYSYLYVGDFGLSTTAYGTYMSRIEPILGTNLAEASLAVYSLVRREGIAEGIVMAQTGKVEQTIGRGGIRFDAGRHHRAKLGFVLLAMEQTIEEDMFK